MKADFCNRILQVHLFQDQKKWTSFGLEDKAIKMKNVIITGATGMVGGIVLRECLASKEVGKVTLISRRSTGLTHAKLEEVIHSDFTDFSTIQQHFQSQDIAYFCIGVYTGQVSNEVFKRITVDFTKAFSTSLKANSPAATFCFLSGEGADPKEKSRVAFARFKGMAENFLIQQNYDQLYIFRPAYIYPVQKREEPNWSYRLMRQLYPLVKNLYSRGVITSEQLALAMFKGGMEGANEVILNNVAIKSMVDLAE